MAVTVAPQRISWIDVREAGSDREAIVEEAIHQRVSGVVAGVASDLADLPPTVTRVLLAPPEWPADEELHCVDLLLLGASCPEDLARIPRSRPGLDVGVVVEVSDQATLDLACRAASECPWTLLRFTDPTKIPLEIVLASAGSAASRVVTAVQDLEEATVVLGVLERGPDGVMLPVTRVGEATALRQACTPPDAPVPLHDLEIVRVVHVGMGDRACVDTCSYLGKHEGLLVGSHAHGMILTCSETHPLPYMPTRPFRVNAGAIHSYTLGGGGRTRYLSELETGSRVLAVDHTGVSRQVVVGRVKIESRPLLQITARSASGVLANLTLQDDWHVRILGPGPTVLNVTELRPGSRVLGHLPDAARHVGIPIQEFCREQ